MRDFKFKFLVCWATLTAGAVLYESFAVRGDMSRAAVAGYHYAIALGVMYWVWSREEA